MTAEAPTISETTEKIQAALRDYIEATYHVGHPTLIAQRRALLEQEGVLFRAPFIESTPRYQDGPALRRPRPRRARSWSSSRSLAAPAGELKPRPVRPAVHPPGGGAGVDHPRRDEPGHHDRHRLRQDRVLPAADAGQARQRSRSAHRSPSQAPAVRALILYPMNALVNDQLGRLRLLLGRPARHDAVPGVGGASASLRPLHQPDPLPGGPQPEEGPAAAEADRGLLHPAARSGGRRVVARPRQRGGADRHAESPGQVAGQARPAGVVRGEERPLAERGRGFPPGGHAPGGPGAPDPPRGAAGTAGRADHELLDARVHADAPAGTARLRHDPVVAGGEPGREVPPDHRRGAPVPGRGGSGGGAAAAAAAVTARHHPRPAAGHLPPAPASPAPSTPASSPRSCPARTWRTSGPCVGGLAERSPSGTGSIADAEALAAVPLARFYDGEDDDGAYRRRARVPGVPGRHARARARPRANCWSPRSAAIPRWASWSTRPCSRPGRSANSAPSCSPTQTPRWPTGPRRRWSRWAALRAARRRRPGCCRAGFTRSSGAFPGCGRASTRTARRSTARRTRCRVLSASCTRSRRRPARCGARVFELFTCRHCGSAYARAYTNDLASPGFLWHEPGVPFLSAGGSIDELSALDLLLEEPSAGGAEPADLDLVTGRLNPKELGDRIRGVFISRHRAGETVKGADDDDEDEASADGEFKPCGVCGATGRLRALVGAGPPDQRRPAVPGADHPPA